MYYVMIVKDGAIEEICGITEDKKIALEWQAKELGGIAPKRIIKEFTELELQVSNLEARWRDAYTPVGYPVV